MSTPDDATLRDLAAAYALGALTPAEARAFETYLETSPDARREVEEYRETAALLVLGGGEAQPAPALKGRVMAAIDAARQRSLPVSPARRVSPVLWAGLAAAILAAVGLGVRAQSLSRQLAERDSAIASLERRVDELGQTVLDREAILASIFSRGVELVQLTASGDPDPAIQLFWDRQRHSAVLRAERLKPAPPGRTYQLWWIRDGKPVPSVTFDVGTSGEALVRQVTVPSDGELSAAAVTEEPAGGSQQPTSPILLVGQLPKS